MDGKIGTNGALTVGRDWYSQSTAAGSGDVLLSGNGGLGFFNAMGRNKETGKVIQLAASSSNIYGANSWATHHFVYTPNYLGASNFAQWVGINTASKTDGQTATITLPGGINENQSGMTIEGTYYVQDNGDITTAVTDYKAGIALTAGKILVDDNTVNGATNLSAYATTSALTTGLVAKAPLASPTFTGTPAAPTAAVGTNTTQVATTAFVTAATAGSGGFEAVADGAITAGTAVTLEAATGKVKQVQSALSFYPSIGTHLTMTAQYGGNPVLNYLGSDKFYAKPTNQTAYLGNYNSSANTITWSGDLETSLGGGYQGGWSNVVDNHYFYVGTSTPPLYGISSTNQSATLYLSEINVAGNSVNNSVNTTTLETNLSAGSSNSHANTITRYTQTINNQAYAIHPTALSTDTYAYAGVNTNLRGVSYGQKDRNALMLVGGTVDTSASTIQGGTMSNTGSAGDFYSVGRPICAPIPGQAGCFLVGYQAGKSILGNTGVDTDSALATYKVTTSSSGTKGTNFRLLNTGGTGTAMQGGLSLSWDSTNSKMLAIHRSTNSGTIQCIHALTLDFTAGTVSATSPVAQSDLSVYYDLATSGGMGTTGQSSNCMWVASKGYFIIWYDDAANSNYLTYRTITPDYGNNTFTLGLKTVLSSTNITSSSGGGNQAPVYDPDRERMTVLYKTSARGTSSFALFALSTIANWVGVAAATVADGATVAVTLPGDINENQSGMTIEGTYYVQENGTITTSSTDYKAGVALTATNLLVADNTANATAGSTGATGAAGAAGADGVPYFTVTVTVAGGKLVLDGTSQQTASLIKSGTYRFDQSDSTNATHPLRFSTDSGNSSAFTTGVTEVGTPGSSGAYTQIVVEQDTAGTLYYYCGNHSNMGGEVIVGPTAGGAGGTTYTAISSATTAVAGNAYIVDTGAAVTVTLPASAAIGDTVAVIDGTGTAATNNITIGRNSHKIQGDAADMTVSLNRAAFELVYYNATHGWLLTKV